MPSTSVSTYLPVKARSVPARLSTAYSSGVSRVFHSSSLVGTVSKCSSCFWAIVLHPRSSNEEKRRKPNAASGVSRPTEALCHSWNGARVPPPRGSHLLDSELRSRWLRWLVMLCRREQACVTAHRRPRCSCARGCQHPYGFHRSPD